MNNVQSVKKISLGFVLSWILGVFLGLIGIISIFPEPILGIVMFIMAAVLLPPINKLVYKKWNFRLSTEIKTVVIIIGFIIFGTIINTSHTEQKQNNYPRSKQYISNTEQPKDEIKPKKEQVKTTNSLQPVFETKKPEKITTTADTNKIPTTKTEDSPTPAKNLTIPAEYKSALNKANTYANTMHMSKQGVYDQLISEYGEKFSTEAAQYAIENINANWNANALAKAKTYQDTMNMSPAAIHDQLSSEYGEKFTQSETDYAIQHLNN